MTDVVQNIISSILAIIFLLGLCGFGVFAIYCELICNKKEKEYLNTLNDHDVAVIQSFLTYRKINVRDFQKKHDNKEVNNEDK